MKVNGHERRTQGDLFRALSRKDQVLKILMSVEQLETGVKLKSRLGRRLYHAEPSRGSVVTMGR